MIKFFTQNINRNKIFLIIIAALLIILDIYFAYTSFIADESKQFPTFSKLYYKNQGQLLWFTYIFGLLTGKIFYNTFTTTKKHELRGLIVISITILLLFILGKVVIIENVAGFIALIILISGIISANLLWPQYTPNTK